jgi:tetratricopeptide (TPR) repeat protein
MDHQIEQQWKQNVELLMDRVKGIEKEIQENGTLAASIGVTEEEKQQAYALGYQFFQQKKYDKAMTIFEALHVMDPLNKDFAKAMAATLQMSGNLPDAAIHYLMAYFFHPEELEFALQSGRCMIEVGEVPQAYFILNAIVEAKRFPANDSNKAHLATIRTLLEGLSATLKDAIAKSKKAAGGAKKADGEASA